MTSLAELARRLEGRLEDADSAHITVCNLAAADCPKRDAIVVVESARGLAGLDLSEVGAVVLPEGVSLEGLPAQPSGVIRVKDTRLALAQLSALFDNRPEQPAATALSASVHPAATLGRGVAVGEHAVIEAEAVLGEGVSIGAGCYIGHGVRIGAHSRLYPNVSLYDGVTLGERVIVHSGAVIGSDGFGYALGAKGALKIHHLGTVEIGDEVEIGAGSCVDRGTLCPTRIGARSKIDNLCQIGHNVQIGSDCLIAGLSGIGGSTVIEDGVILGGAVGVADHLRLGKGARVGGRGGVTKSIPAGQTWAGFPAQPYRAWVRQLYLMGRLERIWEWVKGAQRP